MSYLTVLAFLCAAAFLALGTAVSHGTPPAIDLAVRDALRGHALALAIPLTQLGRFPAYVALCALTLVFGLVRRAWLVRALVAIVVLVGAWKTSDLYKDHFMRPRPPDQLVFHETTFSFPSGHATLALAFYGAWALYAWRGDLAPPVRRGILAAAAILILAIGWSRLALGAHDLTDVLGGYLLGAVFLCILAVATRRAATARTDPFERRRAIGS